LPATIQRRALTKQTLAEAARALAARDEHFAYILSSWGPPPMWRRPPGFATLIKIILEQQVSLSSAATMYQRLQLHISPFTSDEFIRVGPGYLRSLGITRQKASYFISLAEASVAGRIDRLPRMSDERARQELMAIKGIGPWSAVIYLLMVLRRPDIWPSGDIALATAVKELRQLQSLPTASTLLTVAENWRPFRSVAARMLWQYYLARRNRL